MNGAVTQKVRKLRETLFPRSVFWIVLGSLLVMAGVHQGILIGMNAAGWPPILQVHIVILLWVAVAAGLTLFVRSRM